MDTLNCVTLQPNESLSIENALLHQDKEGILIISPSKQVRIKHTNITTPTLQRAFGVLKVGDVELDKSKPKSWNSNQIQILLKDCDIGVGLDEEDILNTKLKGNGLENIVDALISFNGDKEAKIEHAVKEINCYPITAKSIVRWAFSNLLEYK